MWREIDGGGKKGRKDEEEREGEGEGNLGARPRARERGGGERLKDTTTRFPALSPNTELLTFKPFLCFFFVPFHSFSL